MNLKDALGLKEGETPFKESDDSRTELTVAVLMEMLKSVPGDYIVSFDSALGLCIKGDFTVYHDSKRISING